MTSYVVWLDHDQAKVFRLDEQSEAPAKLHRDHKKSHQRHPHDALPNDRTEHEFYAKVAGLVNSASEVLLVGPGQGKVEFKHYLEKHFAGGLAKKVAGVQTVDHPTDNEIVALGRKFFNQLHRTGIAPH